MIRAPRPAAEYTPEAAAARVDMLRQYGWWPGMVAVPGTGLVRLTHDPDVAGVKPSRDVERTAAAG